jgi:hypothetical protein
VTVVYQERNAWATLVASAGGVVVYVVLILQQAAGGPLHDVEWVPIMLGTIAAAIVAAVAVSIVWGTVAGRGDPDGVGRSDERDRDIARLGDRVGQAFLVIGGLAGILLCALAAEPFYIANALFAGFALSALVGGVARVSAYRRGLV